MIRGGLLLIAASAIFVLINPTPAKAEFDDEIIDDAVLGFGQYFEKRQDGWSPQQTSFDEERFEASEGVSSFFQAGPGDDIDDVFQDNPVNGPIRYDGNYLPSPGLIGGSRRGSAYIVGMEVLYQTFAFFGVKALIKRENTRVEFKVIESTEGYFQHLTKLDVAFALREFARYLNAHLCNRPTMENFYKAFTQVPPEEIGFRFKYDMAWALLGNPLPRDANNIFLLGKRWTSFGKLIQQSNLIKSQGAEETKEARRYVSILGDIVEIVTELNKLTCFVDIRPDPKEELRKRLVVKKILNLQRSVDEKYADLKDMHDLIEEAAKIGIEEQLESLRSNN